MDFISQLVIFTPMYVSFFWALVLLYSPKPKNKAKFILGIFMVAAMMVYLSHSLYFTKHYSYYLIIDPIYTFSSLAVYPLYYWYIRMLTSDNNFQLKYLRLLLPSAILFISSATLYLFMDNPVNYVRKYYFNLEVLLDEDDVFIRLQRIVFYASRIVFTIQVIWFLVIGMKLTKAYSVRIKNFYSNVEGKLISWVKWLMVIFTITSVFSIAANVVGRYYFFQNQNFLIIPALSFSILIFLIGFLGKNQDYTISNLVIDEAEPEPISNQLFGKHPNLKKRLIILFEEDKVFKKDDLKIIHISNLLTTNRTYISKLINDEFNCSFSDFVNRYRIEESKKIMISHLKEKYTLDQVADDSGFTSVNAFIRNFKKYEGITPGQYRDENTK